MTKPIAKPLNPDAKNWTHEITRDQARRAIIEVRQGVRIGELGFRIRCISSDTGSPRLIGAAEQWRNDYDMGIEGVRERPDSPGKVDGGSSPGGYSDATLAARTRHRECCQALGSWASFVLHLVLVGDPDADDAYNPLSSLQLGKRLGYHNQTAHGVAIAALEALADFYERPRRGG